jgi:hypothetical protein
LSRAVDRYLSRHALAEHKIAAEIPGKYEHVVVVPACREPDLSLCFQAIDAASRASQTLVIGVVNAQESATAETHRTNAAALAHFGCAGRAFSLTSLSARCDLLIINRAEAGRFLRPKRGVGTARRIGADIALKLWEGDGLRSDWIHSTDADARVPLDYFQSPKAGVGRVIPFRHDTSRTALLLYEVGLRLYALGLASAASPYAFQTVGSALAFRCEAYAQVGGFPQREAGEDFYLLNKLAKVGPILRSAGDPITLVDRDSDRVPFGTGPGARRVEGNLGLPGGYRTYDARCFLALQHWNYQLRLLAVHRDTAEVKAQMMRFSPAVWSCLRDLGVERALTEAVRNTRKERGLQTRLFCYFDGFRTLRFIHLLRDRLYPLVPWRDALAAAATRDGFEVPDAVGPVASSDLVAAAEEKLQGQMVSMEAYVH